MTKWNTIYDRNGNEVAWVEDTDFRERKNKILYQLAGVVPLTKSKSELQYELSKMMDEENE